MQYRKLGRTDLEVSVVALGLWAVADDKNWGAQDEQAALDSIDAALDVGINFIDTAEGYGNGYSEELLGRALKGKRDRAIVATKASPGTISEGAIREHCETSLRYLQTDYIDLYQLHWPVYDRAAEDIMADMLELKQAGKIRHIGVSNFGVENMREMLPQGRFESNQLAYNLLWRSIEYDVQPMLDEHEISILAYSPMQQGLLTGKFATADDVPDGRTRTVHFSGDRPMSRHSLPGFEADTFATIDAIRAICAEADLSMNQVALSWVMHQSCVASVVAGARSIEQVHSNAAAADVTLSDDLLARLDSATAELKSRFGGRVDMWGEPPRSR
jgi:aryl-alcohol dehydrogenase-like predicted oxidoreductase